MNESFKEFYEFDNSGIFLSKKFYCKYSQKSDILKIKYSLHPYTTLIPTSEQFLKKIINTANEVLSNNFNPTSTELTKLLDYTNNTDFTLLLRENFFNEEVLKKYADFLDINCITKNQIYFTIKSGHIVYNQKDIEEKYFEKWNLRIWTPKHKFPKFKTFENYINNNISYQNEFCVFDNSIGNINKTEIIETFREVLNFKKSIKIFPNNNLKFFDIFSTKILFDIYNQYLRSSQIQNIFEIETEEVFNLNRGLEKKLIIH